MQEIDVDRTTFSSLLQVRLWMNSAWENIQCLIGNNRTNSLQMHLFYLNVYGQFSFLFTSVDWRSTCRFCLVLPRAFQWQVNQTSVANSSLFFFHVNQSVEVACEIHSSPRTRLTLNWKTRKHSPLQTKETVECINEDLSTIYLAMNLCLEQRNWRLRVRIQATLRLTIDDHGHELTCSSDDFLNGTAAKSSIQMQFFRGETSESRGEREKDRGKLPPCAALHLTFFA